MNKSNDEIIHNKALYCQQSNLIADFAINVQPCEIRKKNDCYKIIVVLQNELIENVNGEQVELKEHEALIVRPNDIHYQQSENDAKYAYVVASAELFEEILKKFCRKALTQFNAYANIVPKIKCSYFRCEQILSLTKSLQEHKQDDEQLKLLEQILACVVLEYEESFYAKSLQKKIDDSFCAVMIKMFNQVENIGLKLYEVCAKYPCSVEYAIRRFKLEGLDTPNNVFKKIKLDYACLLLKTTNCKIMTVSEKIGFNNIGYFNKIFLSVYGVTPTDFRNKYRAKS